MIKTGNDILFQEPTCETRRLRRSVVLEASEGRLSVRFVAEPFAFEPGQEALMYFNGPHEFMQQVGRVLEIQEEDAVEGPVFLLETVGDAISAESRQDYRVSTLSAGIQAIVGPESELPVQDLSATGFAVLASSQYEIGQTVPVSIEHEEERCHGIASVQSIRELGPGRTRYGIRAIQEDPHSSVFLEVLRRISLSVQRAQLQRSGAQA
ncbi:MAG: hypothetical protein ACX98W_22175 [bacterium]